MMKRSEVKKTALDKAVVSRILRKVSIHEGFHFFRAVGDPTGMTATSLADFVEKMRTVDVKSVNFHFARKDFEKWLNEILGDAELSKRISRISKETQGEKLRNEIIQVAKGRIDELKGA